MNLDRESVLYIFSFLYSKTSHTQLLALSPFSVCRQWRDVLCGPDSVHWWQNLFHSRYPRFLQPISPSKKRSVSAVSLDYRMLFLYTSAILQIDSSFYDPVKMNKEFEEHMIELPQDNARHRRELLESIALRLFSRKFTQFVSYNRHHLLYGPAGCGKATLIESLARMWGSYLLTIQYPCLVRVSTRIEWSSYSDFLCNYILSFCDANNPATVHLRNMGHVVSTLSQHAMNSLLKSLPIANVWVIGTTTSSNIRTVQHADHFAATLFIPFPTISEREAFLKSELHPASAQSSTPVNTDIISLPPPPPSSISSPVPISTPSVHLLAHRTSDFTYSDLRQLCGVLREECKNSNTQQIPFVKLMDVLSRVAPTYHSEEAKKFEGSESPVIHHTSSRRLSS